MGRIIETRLDDGTFILVEASEDLPQAVVAPGQRVVVGRAEDLAARAAHSVEEAIDRIKPGLAKIAGSMHGLGADAFEVNFGLKVSVGAFWFITSADANFNVKVSWKHDAAESANSTRAEATSVDGHPLQ